MFSKIIIIRNIFLIKEIFKKLTIFYLYKIIKSNGKTIFLYILLSAKIIYLFLIFLEILPII